MYFLYLQTTGLYAEMLKNKKIQAEIKKRQHQKDREHPTMASNSDIRILQHTINIDQMPDHLPGTRAGGTHGSFMPQAGAPTIYNIQKTGTYQQNMPASVLAAGAMAQAQQKHQRQHPRPHDLAASSSQSSNNMLPQTSAHGRIPGDNTAQGTRGSNLSVSGAQIQTPNGGGGPEATRYSQQRRGHQKPHRPGKTKLLPILY